MTHDIIHYVHIRELVIYCCFYFLYFAGFITKCIYDTIILCLFYNCIKTVSISYMFWMTMYGSIECIINE